MGYEPDPLPFYIYLRNRSYTINFKTKLYSGSLYLPSHVLLPPPHKSASSWNPFWPRSQLIYVLKDHLHLCDLSCLTLLPLVVGWYIMVYESDPLPSYNELRNHSYSIILNYTYSTSTPKINVPRPDPTISSYGSSLASDPPWYRVHKRSGMPPVPQCLPAIYECTPV